VYKWHQSFTLCSLKNSLCLHGVKYSLLTVYCLLSAKWLMHVCVFVDVDDQSRVSMSEERGVISPPTVTVSQESQEAVPELAADDLGCVDNAVSGKSVEVNNVDDSTDGSVWKSLVKDSSETVGNDALAVGWSECDDEFDHDDKKMESRSHDTLSIDVMLDDDAQIENCFNSPYGGE